MQKFMGHLSFVCLIAICGYAFAQNVIVTETTDWQSVPIVIDTTKNTYTITGTVPVGVTQYYYAYPGYRCFSVQRNGTAVPLVYRSDVVGGVDIYCYPE